MSLRLGLVACLASACTVIQAPRIPDDVPDEERERIYLLTEHSWLNWFGIVQHAAIALPVECTGSESSRCNARDGQCYVQFGFADAQWVEGSRAWAFLGLFSYGLVAPREAVLERIPRGPFPNVATRAERERAVERATGMDAIEIVVRRRGAGDLLAALEAQWAAHDPERSSGPYRAANRRYHVFVNNCHHWAVDHLRLVDVWVDNLWLVPRISFWFELERAR